MTEQGIHDDPNRIIKERMETRGSGRWRVAVEVRHVPCPPQLLHRQTPFQNFSSLWPVRRDGKVISCSHRMTRIIID